MGEPTPPPPAAASAEGLPPGWTSATDPSSGRVYYVNNITQTTQWDRPAPAPAPTNPPPPTFQQTQSNSSANMGPGYQPAPQQPQQMYPQAPQYNQQPQQYQPPQPQYNPQVVQPQPVPVQPQPIVQPQPVPQPQYQPQQLPPSAPAYAALPQSLAPPPAYTGFIRFDEGSLGIEFVLRQGNFILTKVVRGGAAARKGVRVGQVIESVYDGYGRPVQANGAPQLAAQMRNAPRPLNIKFVNKNVVVVQKVYAGRPYHVYNRKYNPAIGFGAAVVTGAVIGAALAGPPHHHHHRGRHHHHRGRRQHRGRGWRRGW